MFGLGLRKDGFIKPSKGIDQPVHVDLKKEKEGRNLYFPKQTKNGGKKNMFHGIESLKSLPPQIC